MREGGFQKKKKEKFMGGYENPTMGMDDDILILIVLPPMVLALLLSQSDQIGRAHV